MAERLVLLDSASMYFRAFFGVPNRFFAPDGTPVNAVRGFTDAVARVIEEFRPRLLVACWDDDWRPQFRVDLVPTYKGHRVAVDPSRPPGTSGYTEDVDHDLTVQEPIIVSLLAAVGIARVGAAGFEADDVIAQLTRDHPGPVDILTGDRDLFQLVDDSRPVRVIYTGKGMNNLQIVTDDWLLAKYGVPGRGYADLAILRGDSSDGLPGVAGVGEKTAASLVQRFGSLNGILAAADDPATAITPAVRRKLQESADYVAAADPAVRLVHPVPLPAVDASLPLGPEHPQDLVDLVDRWNIESPVNRLLNALHALDR